MGWTDNQLIANRDSCEVKGCNSTTVRGGRTQPPLMAIQITNKPKGVWVSSAGTAAIDARIIKNLVISVRAAVKTEYIKVLFHTTHPKKQHFATTTLKFRLEKCSVTISYIYSPRCPRPEASCPGTTRWRDRILEPATLTREAYLRPKSHSKTVYHTDMKRWSGHRFPARPHALLQSILQTAGTGHHMPGLVSTSRSLRHVKPLYQILVPLWSYRLNPAAWW